MKDPLDHPASDDVLTIEVDRSKLKPAAFYGRISKEDLDYIKRLALKEGGEEVGFNLAIERQRKAVEKRAFGKGFYIGESYIDRGTSAWNKKVRRPEYDRLLKDVGDGHWSGSAVFVFKLDRLLRRAADAGGVADLFGETKTGLVSANEEIDASGPTGRVLFVVMAAFAQLESETMALRLKAKADEILAEGRHHGGGTRAFGHTSSRGIGEVITPENAEEVQIAAAEAEIVREVAERLLNGQSLSGIAYDLKMRGVRGPKPKQAGIRAVSWRRILMSPRMIGKRESGGKLSKVAGMPPILDELTWKQVTRLLKSRDRGKGASARSHLLTGLLRCGIELEDGHVCGRNLKAWATGKTRTPAFACLNQRGGASGCGRCSIPEAPVESFVVSAALAWLERLDLSRLSSRRDATREATELEQMRHRVEELRERLVELAYAHHVEREIDRATYLEVKGKVDGEIDGIERQITRLEGNPILERYAGHGIYAAWGKASFDERRLILSAAIDSVTVGPGFRARPSREDGTTRERIRLKPTDRLSIHWRHQAARRSTKGGPDQSDVLERQAPLSA